MLKQEKAAARGKNRGKRERNGRGRKRGIEKTHLRPEASDQPCQMYKRQRAEL